MIPFNTRWASADRRAKLLARGDGEQYRRILNTMMAVQTLAKRALNNRDNPDICKAYMRADWMTALWLDARIICAIPLADLDKLTTNQKQP